MSTPKETATIAGEIEVPVTLRDGTKQTCYLRQLPIRKFNEMLIRLGRESDLIELFTGKQPDWIDSLSEESHIAVLKAGMEINQDPFWRWVSRTEALEEKLKSNVPRLQKTPGV